MCYSDLEFGAWYAEYLKIQTPPGRAIDSYLLRCVAMSELR